jgi:hypothetical protein
MKKWIILLALGLLLLLPEAWYLISDPIRPGDATIAFEDLAEIPAFQLRQQHSVNLSLTAPDSAAWRRIRRSWGDPEFAIVHVRGNPLPSVGECQHCFDAISVRVTQGENQLSLGEAGTIYGFGTDSDGFPSQCKSLGNVFRIPPGSRAQVNITAQSDRLTSDTKVIVRPVWPYTKDKLVGLYLGEDIRLTVKWLAVVGLGIILLAGLLLVRERRLPSQFTLQNNVPA